MALVVGVDFDNTVISYDAVMHRAAVADQLIAPSLSPTKRAIRDTVRAREGGEAAWRRLQALVYGVRIGEAGFTPGVEEFFRACRGRGVPVYIVSHKTVASAGEPAVDLRAAALRWMRERGVFAPEGLGLDEAHVFFEYTRAAKLSRIQALGCTHFVDDLEETFRDPAFPAGVERILYDPHGRPGMRAGIRSIATWEELADSLTAHVV